MNISPWVKAELIINRALESHRKFQSEKDKLLPPKLTTLIICKGKLQVDPRPGYAQRQLQTLLSGTHRDNCATSVWPLTPLNTEKLAAAAK